MRSLSRFAIARSAQEAMAKQTADLSAEIAELKEQAAFLHQLVGEAGPKQGLSIARLAVIPLQDLLGLDGTRRMNTPGTTGGNNWRFRFAWDEIPVALAARLHARNAAHRR